VPLGLRLRIWGLGFTRVLVALPVLHLFAAEAVVLDQLLELGLGVARYRAVEPEQWLQRHPEAGSSWPSWPKASQNEHGAGRTRVLVALPVLHLLAAEAVVLAFRV